MDEQSTIIIGAGQAGLATAFHLTRRGVPCLVLDERDRVGDVWRARYSSLRLFTPTRLDGLPGLAMDGPGNAFPSAHDMGDYLERYATQMHLPVRSGVRVSRVSCDADGFRVATDTGDLVARTVVVAAGGHRDPWTPELARALDPGIAQVHAAAYRDPTQLPAGPVLVVGASHSGADIALELARAGRDVTLSGRVRGELPFGRGAKGTLTAHAFPFVSQHVLTVRTPMGRKLRPQVRGGGAPLLRVKLADLAAAGVRHTPARVAAVRDGRPVLDDGTLPEARSVVWATGYRDDFSWVEPAPLGDDGYPVTDRGVVAPVPGLYFMGLPFQYAFSSAMVLGVGRDAAHVARHIATADRARARTLAAH
ncbi:flavin-containing monooxygenase [Cellulomonas sp. McL0617]|uniref:flavin-containing monooxygenase n=1 Tax=Cellulomonas sp. McL0617 TaxID=3415675 RepID=UPI003CF436C0